MTLSEKTKNEEKTNQKEKENDDVFKTNVVGLYFLLKKNDNKITEQCCITSVIRRNIGKTVGLREKKKNFCPPPVVVVIALLSGFLVLAQCAPPKR